MPKEGPRQVWTWSRVDGSVVQRRVRPSKFADCWIEEWPNGWGLYDDVFFCNSHDEAVEQARAHFRKIMEDAQAVLARLA